MYHRGVFDPNRTPPTPIPAASVILVRAGAGGLAEILLVKRSGRSGFMSSSFVFPGGKLDSTDVDLAAAARRELAEEAHVTLPPGAPLAFWARWVTPSAEPKRFDATFFVARCPDGQEPRVDDRETVQLAWVTAAEGLERHDAGDPAFRLPPPQLWTLKEIVGLGGTVDAIFAAASGRSSTTDVVCAPRFCETEGAVTLLLPWDPDYATRGVGSGDPAPAGHVGLAESRVILDGQTWRLRKP